MFSFQAPILLWLLPLAAVPLLLHLLSRQLPPRLAFPTTRFLLKSPRPQHGHRRWQDWLLMLCRMALIALLCFALAGPRWSPPVDHPTTIPQPPALAILLDASASMLPHADQARTVTAKLLAEHPGWEIAIFTFDHSSNLLSKDSLDTWQPGYAEGHPVTALRQAGQWLAQHANSTESHLAIVSDFQHSNWNTELPGIPPKTQLELHEVSNSQPPDNAAITSVQSVPVGENQLRMRIGWRNWGDKPQHRTLNIFLGAKHISQEVELPPHAEGATAVVTEWSPAENHASAILEPADSFPADDRYCFWAQRNPAVPVLLLLPDNSSDGPLADELEFFLQRALTAERPGVPGHFTVQSLGASSLTLVDLRNFALVILAGCVERLTPDATPPLREYLSTGGNAVFLPGCAPVAAWRYLHENGFITVGEQGLSRQSTGLGEVPAKTLLAHLFPATAPSDLHLFTIRQILRIPLPPTDTILLQTLDGLPALIQHDAEGGGTLFAFTFAFHHEVTDFPLTQSFLPIVREICSDATQSHSETIRLLCGEPFPSLTALDGTSLRPELLEDTALPGLARLGSHPVEINVSPLESQPNRADLEELRRILQRTDDGDATTPDDLPQVSLDLRPWIYTALAVLAILELLLLFAGHPVQHDSEKHIFSTLWR